MSRVSIAIVLALCGVASADTEPRTETVDATPTIADPRAALAAHLADEAAVIATTRTTVADKLRAADAVRVARLRAAYRLLRAPARAPSAADRLAIARRRAAARVLIERDRDERTLLADELAALVGATERTITATAALPSVALPETIAWPAKGTIARRFGTIAHEKSKTTLARRGLDIEVEAKAAAKAPADGTIRYAGPIRGLDQGLVIDHGGYFTVVAKLGELAVATGAKVVAGDQIGRAARHRVYLEVRVKLGPGGLPIDPEPLLVDTDKKSR